MYKEHETVMSFWVRLKKVMRNVTFFKDKMWYKNMQ